MASDYSTKKAYELLEKKRLANVAKNAAEGRTMNMVGIPFSEKEKTAGTLSDLIDTIKEKGGAVTNSENTIKTTPNDVIGINPEVRNKSKFFNLDQKLGNVGEELESAGKVANEEGSLVRNAKGFSKVLPALGLAGTALGALSIANKVHAGELGNAGLEALDLTTDYVPGVGQAKAIARSAMPTDLGSGELPSEEMDARNVYNEAIRRSKEGQKISNPSPEQPLLGPEDRVKAEDQKEFSKIIERLRNK